MDEPLSPAMSAALDEIVRAVVAKADPALMREMRAEYAQSQAIQQSCQQRDGKGGTAVLPMAGERFAIGVQPASSRQRRETDWTFLGTVRRNGVAPPIEEAPVRSDYVSAARRPLTLSSGVGVILELWTVDADDLSPAARSVIGRLPGMCRNVDCDGGGKAKGVLAGYCSECAPRLTYRPSGKTAADRMIRQASKPIVSGSRPSEKERRLQQMRTVAAAITQRLAAE